MATEKNTIDPAILSDLVPMTALTPDNCQELAAKSELYKVAQGKYLFKRGGESNCIYYVIKGSVELIGDGGERKQVVGGYRTSKLPLEQNNTVHQFSALTKSEAFILKVDPNLLDILLTWEQSGGYVVHELAGNGKNAVAEDDDWMSRLLQAQVFHRIPPANIQSIFMKMEANHFSAGEQVIKQGQDGEHFYIIRDGTCKVVRQTRKNPEGVVLAKLSVGDNFGEEALISGGKRNASIVMLTDGVLMSLSKKDFLELMNEPLLQWVGYNEALTMVSKGAVWLDVRLPTEYQNRRIETSINIPLPILRARLDRLDTNKKYIVYCDTGRRSSTATYILTQNDYDASVLQNGLQSIAPEELAS